MADEDLWKPKIVRKSTRNKICFECGGTLHTNEQSCLSCGNENNPSIQSKVITNGWIETLKSLTITIMILLGVILFLMRMFSRSLLIYNKNPINNVWANIFYFLLVFVVFLVFRIMREKAYCPKCKTLLRFNEKQNNVLVCSKCKNRINRRYNRLFIWTDIRVNAQYRITRHSRH